MGVAMNDWVSQMVLLIFTILAGVATWLATRKRGESGAETDKKPESVKHPHPTGGTILNGYATVLQKALDRAEWLQERVHDLERQLDDCERRRITRTKNPPTATRNSNTSRRSASTRTRRSPAKHDQ